ncbi:hypothetical protein ABT116_05300 [Streptomyces sp. NPDC002130]|uniref:hypothetical protein n=1 Tax=Streptomyces sp. NPDC002130 TaxID=3155568 RepID=UPI003321B87B
MSEGITQNAKAALKNLTPDQARRDEVSREITASKAPGYIRTIESSEVLVHIDPDMLPYGDIDYPRFTEEMKERYNLHLDSTKLESVISNTVLDPQSQLSTLSEGQKARMSQAVTESIRFRDGRFPGLGIHTYTPINAISLRSQTLHASVHGPTAVAELLIQEMFELMWAAASAPRKWESDEVQREIALKSYGTATKVDFGENILGLLSPALCGFLRENLSDGLEVAGHMMARSALDQFDPPSNVVGTVALDDLTLRFSVLDLATGRAESPYVRVAVTSKSEMGKGVADIVSELPFEDHVKLVEGIAHTLQELSQTA